MLYLLFFQLFKSQNVRGFCHLYDGQEAIAAGLKAALAMEDPVITAYRDHGIFLARGGSVFVCFS
jgi:pyruvate dehydrogenase E1 component alpha subunit